MSNQQQGNYVDCEPLSNRQKSSDGGPMYDEAAARKMLKEVVLVSARDSEEAVIGFDPDDAALDYIYYYLVDNFVGKVTPMIYFARKGDLKMCRYLASRGASTTKVAGSRFPMHAAARQSHLEVCKFLQANGANHDIWKEDSYSRTPFHAAILGGRRELVRWLVLQGALCADGSSEKIDGARIYPKRHCGGIRDLISRQCERLVEWAKEVTQSHSGLVTFLLGTQPRAPDKDQNRTLQWLSGHPGVRKHIGDFVGLEVTKGKQLRILRQVVDVVPSFIETDDED